jgi:predicted RNA binding protein YcfA (HicA-like mRNA interferase family)
MSKVPVVSPDDCVAALSRFGYAVVRQKGSHARMRAIGRNPVTVPIHKGKPLKRGTLASILRTAEISVEEFLSALGR